MSRLETQGFLVIFSKKRYYLEDKIFGRPLIQGWCFHDKIPNATSDHVLMLLRYGWSKHAKVTGKECG
jgi:hypothetical protein